VTLSQTAAAGTAAASTVSTTVEKTTGLTLSTTDPIGRQTHMTYDVAGRLLTKTDPAGLQTVTEYGDNVIRITDPTNITRSEYVNVLGHVVKITDNIAVTGAGTAEPTKGRERIIETREYEKNSSKVTITDAQGLESVTVTDVFGRPTETITPTGVRQVTEYDDVANTVRTGINNGHR
jgi:YD repeat-containing protein